MGDFRLNVDITLIGRDGKERKIDWWVNYSDSRPQELFKAFRDIVEQSGFDFDDNFFYKGDFDD